MKKILCFILIIILSLTLNACNANNNDKMNDYVLTSDFDITNNEYINWYGRTYKEKINGADAVFFNNTASGFEIRFMGKKLEASIYANCLLAEQSCYAKIFIDGELFEKIVLDNGVKKYTLADNLTNDIHTVKLVKITQDQYSLAALLSVDTEGIQIYNASKKPDLKIEFYGDSLTCGHGNLGAGNNYYTNQEDGSLSYAYLATQELNAEISVCAYSGISLYMDVWGLGYNMRDSYKYYSMHNRQLWDFSYDADIIVINMGTNDMSGIFNSNIIPFEERNEALYKFEDAYNYLVANLVEMKASIVETINYAYESLCKSYKDIYFLNMTSVGVSGAQFHPLAQEHAHASQQLVDFINVNVLQE